MKWSVGGFSIHVQRQKMCIIYYAWIISLDGHKHHHTENIWELWGRWNKKGIKDKTGEELNNVTKLVKYWRNRSIGIEGFNLRVLGKGLKVISGIEVVWIINAESYTV